VTATTAKLMNSTSRYKVLNFCRRLQ